MNQNGTLHEVSTRSLDATAGFRYSNFEHCMPRLHSASRGFSEMHGNVAELCVHYGDRIFSEA